MKLNPGFDDEFRPKSQGRLLPARSIGRLTLLVAACALTFAVMGGMEKRKAIVRPNPARIQRALQVPQARSLVPAPRDPFVVMAPGEIDAKMVVPAPVGIDEAMVFNPYAGQDHSQPKAPAQGSPLIPLPGAQPGALPKNVHPHQWPAPAKPR